MTTFGTPVKADSRPGKASNSDFLPVQRKGQRAGFGVGVNHWFGGRGTGFLNAVAAALTLLWGGATALAQTNDGPGILFLHLRIKGEAVSLVKSSVSSGYLKPQVVEEMPGGIYFELASTNGQTLWKGETEDPRVRHLEYEEPVHSGKLKRKALHFNEAEFTVRVPSMPAARSVAFYESASSGPGTNQASSSARKSLGSVTLPARPTAKP